mgnify:FL=1
MTLKKILTKFWKLFKQFWLLVWQLVLEMRSVRGVIALLLTWLTLSGVGLIIIGFIIKNAWLIGVGTAMWIFWLAPLTPLIPITLAVAVFIKRYILRDKKEVVKDE